VGYYRKEVRSTIVECPKAFDLGYARKEPEPPRGPRREEELEGLKGNKAPAVPHTPRSVVQKGNEETGPLTTWTLEPYTTNIRAPLREN
jgi:hypothetical protein